MFRPSSGANRAMLTDVVGGNTVKKSFMDRLLLMSPSIFPFGLQCMGLEVCVLTKPVVPRSVCLTEAFLQPTVRMIVTEYTYYIKI